MHKKQIAANMKDAESDPVRYGQLLSRAEVADRLNVCPHTVARMERRGLIHPIRFNSRLIRYPLSELLRLTCSSNEPVQLGRS